MSKHSRSFRRGYTKPFSSRPFFCNRTEWEAGREQRFHDVKMAPILALERMFAAVLEMDAQ